MVIPRRFPPAFAVLFGPLLSGCQSPVQEGNSVSYGQGSFYSSFLLWFPLGKTGTDEFRVSNFISRSCPTRLKIYGRGGSCSGHLRIMIR